MNQKTCIVTVVHVVLLDSLLPAWSYSDLLNSVGVRDCQVWPPKHRVSRWNHDPILPTSWYISTSGSAAAILNFRCRLLSVFVVDKFVETADPENLYVVVWFLCRCNPVIKLPVWKPPSWISDVIRYPVEVKVEENLYFLPNRCNSRCVIKIILQHPVLSRHIEISHYRSWSSTKLFNSPLT